VPALALSRAAVRVSSPSMDAQNYRPRSGPAEALPDPRSPRAASTTGLPVVITVCALTWPDTTA
jgi:hypothetical protein